MKPASAVRLWRHSLFYTLPDTASMRAKLDLGARLAHEGLQEPAFRNPGLAPGFFMRGACRKRHEQDFHARQQDT
jgi:hypothetical protein